MSDVPVPEFSYEVKKGFLEIKVFVEGEFVHWDYKSLRGRWRRRLPLASFKPYAMMSTSRTDSVKRITLNLLGVFVGYFLWELGKHGAYFPMAGVFTMIASLGFLAYNLIYFEYEWATWETGDDEHTIYFFAGASEEEFVRAVRQLEDMILERQKAPVDRPEE